MPLYDYRCRRCAHTFEELVRSSTAATAVRCPKCDGDEVERQLAAFHVGARTARAAEPPPFCGRCGENRPPCEP
jgi:putative FmdB family regulatory protein